MSKQLAVPFAVDPLGRIAFVENPYQQVAQRLEVLIGTQLRSRVMRPDYGVPVLDYLFEPINETTAALLDQDIRTAIEKWEPRVEVINILKNIEETTLSITVYFTMLDANEDRAVHTASVLVGGTVVTTDV